MPSNDFADIQAIKDFPSLVKYLRTGLGWPVDEELADDLTFDYRPSELGLEDSLAVKVRAIKQWTSLAGVNSGARPSACRRATCRRPPKCWPRPWRALRARSARP